MKYTDEERYQLINDIKGRTITDIYYEEDVRYWVMEFEDGTEINFKSMTRLVYLTGA